jgi:hypothetical protein
MTYFFQEGIPEDFEPDFDLGIFHQKEHLLLQSSVGLHSFSMVDPLSKRISGLIHFHLHDEIANSPLRSPFGSYLFSSTISESELDEFIEFVDARLKKDGVKMIILKNAPDAYFPSLHKLLQRVLFKHHYQLHRDEISTIIPVTDQPFQLLLHRSERKRLRKCRASGLSFDFVSIDQLSAIYKFLRACKEEKGYEISMTLEQLTKVSSAFPNHVILTRVTRNNELIAANISIRVNESVLYNFYHDHQRDFNSFSPVVLLNEGLYQFCQKNKINGLDLGTSMLNGVIKTSLLNFKLRLGAQPSRKLTFVKNIY